MFVAEQKREQSPGQLASDGPDPTNPNRPSKRRREDEMWERVKQRDPATPA